MRNLFLKLSMVALLMIVLTTAQAQSPNLKHALTAKRLFIDYYSPYVDGETADLFDDYDTGIELAYLYNINRWLNLGVPMKFASVRLPGGEGSQSFRQEVASLGLDAVLQLQYQNDFQLLSPYIFAGVGGVLDDWEDASVQIPAGAGLKIRFSSNVWANVSTEYRTSLEDDRNNWHHGIGITWMFGNAEEELPPPPPVDQDGDGITDAEDDCPLEPGVLAFKGCPDTDGDGIADKEDLCPEEAGTPAMKGCPDSDEDGIADGDDNCPNEAGPESNMGCPVTDRDGDGIADPDDSCPDEAGTIALAGCPDSDEDGVADKDDECPTTAGLKQYKGCPDTDGDSVVDKADRCPETPGPVSNNGCPEIEEEDKVVLEFATRAVQFETGKAALKRESYDVLDQIVEILNKYPDYYLTIGGHTDSVGSSSINQRLSEKRAKACYDYILSKGISSNRVSYAGYGETQPVADNNTREGRKLNRRTEFNIFLPNN